MSGSLIPELADMFPDVMVWEKANVGSVFGDKTFEAPVELPVRITKGVEMIHDGEGLERASTTHVTIAGVFGVSVKDRYTFPARYEPRRPPAIAVLQTADENGPHHESVYF